MPHGLDLVQGIFRDRVAEVMEQLHAVNPEQSGRRVGRTARLALKIITNHLLLQLLLGTQLVHPHQQDLVTDFTLLVLILGFGEGDRLHDDNESCAIDDGRIIAGFKTYSELPLA